MEVLRTSVRKPDFNTLLEIATVDYDIIAVREAAWMCLSRGVVILVSVPVVLSPTAGH